MPLYEYECSQCHRRIEKIQKFSDPELTVCPHCGGPLARTITAAAIAFKGGGWYKDLYSSAKPAGAAGSESAASGTTGSEASTTAAAASSAPAAASGESAAAPSTPAPVAPAATPAASTASKP